MRPRVARTEQSPRLTGEWRAWYASLECRCLWLSGDGALVELPAGAPGPAEQGTLRVEIDSNRFVEAQATSAGSNEDGGRRVVLRLQWSDFTEMREWWMNVHSLDPTAWMVAGWRRLARMR